MAQHGVAGRDTEYGVQHMVGRQRLDREGGGDVEVHVVGDGDQPVLVDGDLLAITTAVDDGTNPVARRKPADPVPDLADHARDLEPEDHREADPVRVGARPDLRVGPIASAVGDFDEDLPIVERRRGNVTQRQNIRTAGLVYDNGFQLRGLSCPNDRPPQPICRS